MPDLLLELFSEEIPARMQGRAREDLRRLVTDGLVEAGLTYAGAAAFSTPRRLTLTVQGLTAESRPVREERKGPRVDAPAAALEGFLRSTGLTKDQLEVRADRKAEVYFAVIEKPGRSAPAIVAEVVERVIREFPWPKSMRWGAGSLRWVRPLHSILCLLTTEAGAEVVPLTVDGLRAGATTKGHRFMAPGHFGVGSFDDYAAKLKAAKVMLDPAERAEHIRNDAAQQAFAQGLEVVADEGLLTEVSGLVEWPVVLMGPIGEEFLTLPPEVLQTSMKEHQKFFSVRDKAGRIVKFVTVANRETADDGATILAGNGKVLRARLSDARFFWENDLRVAKAGMGEWAEGLKSVTFHNKLGSQAERVARVAELARAIAPAVGADPDLAARAAELAKLDLRSGMVGEFPELQGTMGRYYVLEAADELGLPEGAREAVADAARDHYSPLGPSDAVPSAPVSVAVALADKIDTLTGFWDIDEKPTGSKDPFALRRAALGVIRLVVGNGVRAKLSNDLRRSRMILDEMRSLSSTRDQIRRLEEVASKEKMSFEKLSALQAEERELSTRKQANKKEAALIGVFKHADATDLRDFLAEDEQRSASVIDLLAFIHDRLKVYLREQGIRHDVIDACLAMPGNDDLTLLVKRAEAVAAFLKTEDGANLLQGTKRAANILAAEEKKDGVEYSFGADVKFAEGPEEKALFAALDAAEAEIGPALAAEDFAAALTATARLRAPIDAFFTAVQVNSDNQIIRRNRLNLLNRIREIAGRVADLGRIEG